MCSEHLGPSPFLHSKLEMFVFNIASPVIQEQSPNVQYYKSDGANTLALDNKENRGRS